MTRELAETYLASVALDKNVSTVDLYFTYGGTCLGLELLKRSGVPGLVAPADMVLSLDEASRYARKSRFDLPSSLREGFALKYSGNRESFSPFCVRGQNSSRRRFWDGTDKGEAQRILIEATEQVPSGTNAIVLQEYVKGVRLSGVFYSYGYDNRTLVEAVSVGQRTFSEIRGSEIVRSTTVTAPHIRAGSVRQANPLVLHRVVTRLRKEIGFDFDIEGYESDGEVIAVQLRPIPEDMPRFVNGHEPRSQPSCSDNCLMTPLIWGVWAQGPAALNLDVPGAPAIMTKESSTLDQCPTIIRRLERGDLTLVIDLVDGFRLSHDPSYLPENILHRQNYAYISVAGSSLRTLRTGQEVNAFIDGEFGFIRRL